VSTGRLADRRRSNRRRTMRRVPDRGRPGRPRRPGRGRSAPRWARWQRPHRPRRGQERSVCPGTGARSPTGRPLTHGAGRGPKRWRAEDSTPQPRKWQAAKVDVLGGQQRTRGNHPASRARPGAAPRSFRRPAKRCPAVVVESSSITTASSARCRSSRINAGKSSSIIRICSCGYWAAPLGQARNHHRADKAGEPAHSHDPRDLGPAFHPGTGDAECAFNLLAGFGYGQAAGVKTEPLGVRTTKACPVSSSNLLSCWDTAEGEIPSSSAAASTPPVRATARRTRSRRGSISMLSSSKPCLQRNAIDLKTLRPHNCC
jgi:hypothetical protein